MSPLLTQLDTDVKSAMKEKNESVLSALRMVKSALKNKQIDLGHELTEDDVVAVMRTMVKQYKDALTDFETAGRTDLAAKQREEIELIERYLPAQMGESQIEEIARTIVKETNATAADMGRVMGAVMKQVAGRADGNAVRAVVQRVLGQ